MSTQTPDFPEGLVPNAVEIRLAEDSLQHLVRVLQTDREEMRFSVEEADRPGETFTLPRSVVRLLKDVVAEMAKGHSVTLQPHQVEISSQQAADLLNVSHPYLISLLEEKIPCRPVDQGYLIRLEDVLAYKRRDDEARLKVLGELVAQAQELNMGY